MQLMTWNLARLGGRFSLLFEPHRHRVMHSALGRFYDQPLDLMVGFIEPDGTERVLPFTTRGTPLYNAEQFERINSITFRAYSEKYRLRFEFNVHGVFYPQDEPLCVMPAFYLEMRISRSQALRRIPREGPAPQRVKMFFRIQRPDTRIEARADTGEEPPGDPVYHSGRIDLTYRSPLSPQAVEVDFGGVAKAACERSVEVRERIVSLNRGVTADADGRGLEYEMPVTEPGSGIKWRLVWGAHCGEPIMTVATQEGERRGRFRYNRYYMDIESVIEQAIRTRDDRLAHSRRFEKLLDQAPLRQGQNHLVNQTFQAYLSNTFWCDLFPAADDADPTRNVGEWFSVMEGCTLFQSPLDVEYNTSPFYLLLWPRLLGVQLPQWASRIKEHAKSGGAILCHDLGAGVMATGQAFDHDMPVEENADFLLLLQAHAHWTGDLSIVRKCADAVEKVVVYLLWTDRDGSGFPSEGGANTIDDGSATMQYARKQTYLAMKRVAALRAGADLLERIGRRELSDQCERAVNLSVERIESKAWNLDHYAICVDKSATGLMDVHSGQALPYVQLPGWDGYSIFTGNGLLLQAMIGQPPPFDLRRLQDDLTNALRETLSPYGCEHSSVDTGNIWISQNLWRDHLSRYLGLRRPSLTQRYWDLQVMSNVGAQSLGYTDSYVHNALAFSPRGVTSLGYFLGEPRLTIDRLAPGGQRIAVEPERSYPHRWPLLALADWKAGRIPICVVDQNGKVQIECETDPVIIRGGEADGQDGESMIG